ncbi:hypothetical protein, partial [Listeria monocytogenes]
LSVFCPAITSETLRLIAFRLLLCSVFKGQLVAFMLDMRMFSFVFLRLLNHIISATICQQLFEFIL